jgi:ubiquinone/menaquinone biosynthesis C-methylase UbiE
MNILNKMTDAQMFVHLFHVYRHHFTGRILELGAGQGWASCLVKRYEPEAHIIATDISPYAIASLPNWERVWGINIDRHYACKSYETREADASVDLVFCFASAHHFVEHEKTLAEVQRILKPTGTALYLFEPTANRFFYRFQRWRINRVRPAVPEDVIVPARFKRSAEACGLQARFDVFLDLPKRHPLMRLALLFPLAKRFLPSAANIVMGQKYS